MTDDQSSLDDYLGEPYDPVGEFEDCGCDDGPVDAADLKQIDGWVKARRLEKPRSDDEWPGTWRVFDSAFTSLPSFINDDGARIRTYKNDWDARIRVFVHIATGVPKESWGPKSITYTVEIHDDVVDFMEKHP